MDTSRLTQSPSPALQLAISLELWDALQGNLQYQHLSSPRPVLSDAYWAYYTQECTRTLYDGGQHVALRTHKDVVHCAGLIKADRRRDDINDALRTKFNKTLGDDDEKQAKKDDEELQEKLDNSINLVASLLLMITFGSQTNSFSGHMELNWRSSDGSLRDLVRDYFDPGVAQVMSKEGVKLERIFTATNLCRIAGLEIIWTDNLVDHLRLSNDDSRVHIFHHVSFLNVQKQSSNSLLPEGLAEETLRTLALLVPSKPRTRAWITKQAAFKNRLLDHQILHCGPLTTDNRRIEHFKFWGDRLVTRKQVFDEARPRTLAQWWHDRRNGVQWYTFWVAVAVLALTVFFGLVQSLEGAMQVYASFKALKEAGPIVAGVHG